MENEEGLNFIKALEKLGFEIAYLTAATGSGIFSSAELIHEFEGVGPITLDLKKLSVSDEDFKKVFNL